ETHSKTAAGGRSRGASLRLQRGGRRQDGHYQQRLPETRHGPGGMGIRADGGRVGRISEGGRQREVLDVAGRRRRRGGLVSRLRPGGRIAGQAASGFNHTVRSTRSPRSPRRASANASPAPATVRMRQNISSFTAVVWRTLSPPI